MIPAKWEAIGRRIMVVLRQALGTNTTPYLMTKAEKGVGITNACLASVKP
jgi:hypothetical protein